jgi:hypothetical protein
MSFGFVFATLQLLNLLDVMSAVRQEEALLLLATTLTSVSPLVSYLTYDEIRQTNLIVICIHEFYSS